MDMMLYYLTASYAYVWYGCVFVHSLASIIINVKQKKNHKKNDQQHARCYEQTQVAERYK